MPRLIIFKFFDEHIIIIEVISINKHFKVFKNYLKLWDGGNLRDWACIELMNSPDRSLFLDIGWLAVAVFDVVVVVVDHWIAAVGLVIMQHLNYHCHPAMETKENF